MPRVSAEHKEQVRQRLLDAARRVILRDGPEAATTRAILDEAGLSAGALYSYFASKEELFATLADQVIDENIALATAEGAAGEEVSEVLARFATGLLSRPDDSPALAYFRGRMTPDREVQDAVARLNRSVVQRFGPLVAAGQDSGAIAPDIDPEAVVELFDIVFDGLNRRAITDTFATSFERVGQVALRLVLETLLTQQPSHPHPSQPRPTHPGQEARP
jgi:AcrR family transcriptional regulator